MQLGRLCPGWPGSSPPHFWLVAEEALMDQEPAAAFWGTCRGDLLTLAVRNEAHDSWQVATGAQLGSRAEGHYKSS